MKESTIIKQKWFHIYEEIHNDELNRTIKEIMDIYTNKNYICHDLSEVNFSNLQVTNYTNSDKLQYIHSNKIIEIPIDLEKWVDVPIESCNNNKNLKKYDRYKHIKISISYQTKPYFKIKKKIANGYETYFISKYLPHPEFHINLQKGMKLKSDSINFTFYFKNHANKEFDSKFNTKNNLLNIQKEIGKNKYVINLDSEIFNKINEKSTFISFDFYYEVKNQSKFLLLPFFMIFTWFLSIIELSSANLLGFPFVILVTVLIIYLNLIRENYEIPYNKLVIVLFFLTFISLLVKTIVLLS